MTVTNAKPFGVLVQQENPRQSRQTRRMVMVTLLNVHNPCPRRSSRGSFQPTGCGVTPARPICLCLQLQEALRLAKSHKIYLDTCGICSPTASVLPVEESVRVHVINRNFIICALCACLGSKCRNCHQHFLSLKKVLETLTNTSALSEVPKKNLPFLANVSTSNSSCKED